MNLYLIRHGQSVANLEQRHSGWTQLPLTEQGFADAHRAGRLLAPILFDRVYSSDLTRAIQTARTALPGYDPIQLPLIRERHVGCLMEKYVADCYTEYGELYRAARARLDFTAFGGENAPLVAQRVAEFLHMLEADPAENIAAFTHAGFIESTLEHVLGVTIDRTRIRVPNATIVKLIHDGNHWRLTIGTDL